MNNSTIKRNYRFRKVDFKKDRADLIEMECRINYANEIYLKRKYDYGSYRERWYASSRPRRVIRDMKKDLADKRTILEIIETGAGETAGFYAVTLHDVEGFGLLIAVLEDICVLEPHRRSGLGSAMLRRAAALAKKAGARLMRSETSSQNVPSRKLHEGCGFAKSRIGYERVL